MSLPFLSFDAMNSQIRDEMTKAFLDCFDGKWYILGREVESFENEYSHFNKVKHTIGVSNGLDALHLSLKVLDIGVGDEVIVPSNTYIATLLAVSYVGATPVMVEPDPLTYNINPRAIEAAINSKTKAIIPVHLYGQCCEMSAIMDIANRHSLYVIEDNAQSQGATYEGKLAGSFGHLNATSFYPGKNLGALGDAGAVTTDNSELADKVRVYRNYGSQKKYYNAVKGYNMRIDELQASFLRVKLRYLHEWTKERQALAQLYNDALNGIGDVILPHVAPSATHVYHLYVIKTPKREQLQEYLQQNGIGTLIHYPVPPHFQEAYQDLGFREGAFPISEDISKTVLSIPLWPGLQESQIGYVAEHIRKFFN